MQISTAKNSFPQQENGEIQGKIKVSFLGLFAFICGLPSVYAVNLMGEIYASEVILPVFTLAIFFSRKEKQVLGEKVFWMFVLSLILMMIGYVISDLVAGTSKANYLRAWGRNAILFSDIICLSIMAGTDKRFLWWYIFGIALGSIIYLQATGVMFTYANWKLAYCQPVLLLVLVAGCFIPNLMAIWLIIATGIFSFFMDSRSFSSSCIVLAVILWMRRGSPEVLKISSKSLFRIIAIAVVAMGLIILLLEQTSDDFNDRRASSSLGRTAALRIGLIAISDSPILGFGSWGEGTKKYAAMLYKDTRDEQRKLGQSNYQEKKVFLAHSQILQSWMEGGILAAQMFIYYGYQLLVSFKKVVLSRRFDYMTQFYCFFLISAFWALFMSPYSGSHRLNISIAVAIICAVNLEASIKKIMSNHGIKRQGSLA